MVCLAFFQKCQKCLFLANFGAFLGWLIVVCLGLEGLGGFVFLVFVFLFCVAFVSVLFALLLVLWLDVVVLFFVCFLFCFYFVFWFLFWRVQGSSEVAQRATSLGPKPSLFVVFVFCFCFFFVLVLFFVCLFWFWICFCFFFGGFKGQVRWPKGPPHLALNPPYFFVFLFPCFCFCYKNCFPPQKGLFCVFFLCLPLFLFSLF